MALELGMSTPWDLWKLPHDEQRRRLAGIADAGIDHVFTADHVSFHDGSGLDGLVHLAAISGLEPRLGLHVGVYLLALRHPMIAARQIASLAEAAPGRLTVGVGVGGEDRHEVEVCDGWLAAWCSSARFASATAMAMDLGADRNVVWRHGLQVWVGLDASREAARAHVAVAMEGFYKTGFDRFERYTPYGSADDVAEFLSPYVAAGATVLNLTPCGPDREAEVELLANVKRLLDP
jgi:alkanesulfonate monooxygenase SsuD/methylene tetrahydromethanopterin reductase-like flavin-dependent oxidoreductase (luciferase family)